MTLRLTDKLHVMMVLSIFCAISLTLFVLESYIPIPIPFPGIKLGLANIVTLVLILKINFKSAAIVLFVRIFLGSIFASGLTGFLYSFSGGLFALYSIFLITKITKGKYIWFLGIIGALFHNLGQILVAVLIYRTKNIAYYFVILAFFAIVTGFVTGNVASIISKKLIIKNRD